MNKSNENETEKRRDQALRRALNTPPKRKASDKEEKSQGKKEKPSD